MGPDSASVHLLAGDKVMVIRTVKGETEKEEEDYGQNLYSNLYLLQEFI